MGLVVLLFGGEGENEMAAMETGGAGHHGGRVMACLRLSVSGGRAWLTDGSLLGKCPDVQLSRTSVLDSAKHSFLQNVGK
jgi:hypothetical protein